MWSLFRRVVSMGLTSLTVVIQSNLVYNDHPKETLKLVVVCRWSFLTSNIYKIFATGHILVVAVDRWSLTKV